MKIKNRQIKELIAAEYNPRKLSSDQKQHIADSIKRFGIVDPIIVNINKNRKDIIIGGHQRVIVAKELGYKELPCVELDLSRDKERELNIRLNKNTGEFDYEMLNELFDMGDLLDWGFTEDELEMLEEPESDGLTDDDEIPEVEEPICKLGELWKLGNHRLLCGDATQPEDVERLMDGQKADMVFTDPPYNVSYEGYTKEKLTIKSDAMSDEDYVQFLLGTFKCIRVAIKDGAGLYICHASAWQLHTEQALNDCGFEMRNQIIWAKNTFAWGMGRYKFQHEPIFYAHVKGVSDAWYGDKTQSTLWMEKKPAANRLHPTMKPVEIVLRATDNSSKSGDIVYDPFLGSGTTVIACEKTNRKCYGLELDPHYCDVIIKRWEDFTGKKAELICA